MTDNAALSSSKVHYTGIPCGCNRGRWASTHLSSTGDWSRVTCGNCLRIKGRPMGADNPRPTAPFGSLPVGARFRELPDSDGFVFVFWFTKTEPETIGSGETVNAVSGTVKAQFEDSELVEVSDDGSH